MRIPLVDLKAQYESIKEEIDAAIQNVILDTAFIGGKHVKKFEEAFAEFCNTKECVGVGNGTDAIHITLRALGIGEGDEVITAANSFVATSEAITMAGARVVFVDCDPRSHNIDLELVRRAITPRTKAIVPVHLYGRPADMPGLMSLADEHGLTVVEDAAQAHGASTQGKRVGTWGRAACFSFFPGKNLGAYGDAGAIVTDDEELSKTARMIANHGRLGKFRHELEGVNSRLDGMQAAILLVKLKYIEEWTEKRRELAALYEKYLPRDRVTLQYQGNGARHVYHLYVIRVGNRDEVSEHLKKKGIACGIHYPVPLPLLPAYSRLGYKEEDFPVSMRYGKQILSLPMYPELEEEKLKYVCDAIGEIARPCDERGLHV